MAQPIAIAQYAVVTGKTKDTALAMALANNPIPAEFFSWQHNDLPANFVTGANLATSLTERIILLLTELWPSIEQAIADSEVYLLLPEFSGVDSAELHYLLQAIMRQFPSLLRSEHCKVFPYGRAAALMAFAAANAKLNSNISSNKSKNIWLLAVDSLAVATRLDKHTAQAVASEGAVAVCLTLSNTGLVSLLHAADVNISKRLATANTNAASAGAINASADNDELALADLFLKVVSEYNQPLGYIMLPDTGETKLTSAWLQQYQHLHGVVDSNTQFEFPSYFTGELGTAGGLYRLLYMYLSFEQQRLTAPLLQCEIAEQSYRAVSVFSYQSMPQ
ncbi:hypothetical protein [Rheinheimera salexigens]|uniref:Uncharacterized protein n=1 Tax=Rheinheimera salexigens TaxID=1628148 RepID=A0A1E7Q6G4_9GAMM|nr:hypothetical protein [Rheinheimera salexigens]OEY69727.1 hypothetical protein BI198_09250 [Rheinheimera salexigens]